VYVPDPPDADTTTALVVWLVAVPELVAEMGDTVAVTALTCVTVRPIVAVAVDPLASVTKHCATAAAEVPAPTPEMENVVELLVGLVIANADPEVIPHR